MIQIVHEQYKETITPAQELKLADGVLRERKQAHDRRNRVVDYTPIEERDKPCLNGCIHFNPDYAGCCHGGNIVKLVERCPEYRTWMVSQFIDGDIGLKRYLGKLREKGY